MNGSFFPKCLQNFVLLKPFVCSASCCQPKLPASCYNCPSLNLCPELHSGRSSSLMDIFRMSQSSMTLHMKNLNYYLCLKPVSHSVLLILQEHLLTHRPSQKSGTHPGVFSPFLSTPSTRSLHLSMAALLLSLELIPSPTFLELLPQFRHILLLLLLFVF